MDNQDSHVSVAQLKDGMTNNESTNDANNDMADAESGVEPDSNEWIFQDIGESVEFDITAEQAMATLRYFTTLFWLSLKKRDDLLSYCCKYAVSFFGMASNWEVCEDVLAEMGLTNEEFSLFMDNMNEHEVQHVMETLFAMASTAERANLLTKTHHDDLDVISDLLQEKEKDLELAARIGQSLLQRNKNLLLKIEAMEDYVAGISEQENQMRHEVAMKNDLIKNMLREESSTYEVQSTRSEDDYLNSFNVCKDESIHSLEKKCKQLEDQNMELFNEALRLKNMANEAEEQEQDLVVDCVQHLAFAKEQITHLTDEIALKFEDNVAQQEEITELINMVVELQRKHKQLSVENEDLQYQLEESQQNQECLRSQLIDMQRRFQECTELLRENQDEVKVLRKRVESTERECWSMEHPSPIPPQHDSLAMEIEESVKRELTSYEKNRERTSRVFEQVRRANKFLSPGSNYSASNSGNMSSAASVKSQGSVESDDRSLCSLGRSMAESQDLDDSRRRRGFIPAEKLQIVKPMEGSLTLHKWHHLASENVVAGLNVGNVLTPHSHERDLSLATDTGDQISTECSSTAGATDLSVDTKLEDLDNDLFESDDDNDSDFGITFNADKSRNEINQKSSNHDLKTKQSTPVQVHPKSMEKMFTDRPSSSQCDSSGLGSAVLQTLTAPEATQQNRSIITRNSSILASMREARSMLGKDNGSAKSKANAIDILANAMNKANVEAKTGQRILESVSMSNSRNRAASTPGRKDYPDMPRLSKVLEKLALSKDTGKVDLDAVRTPLKMLVEKAAGISSYKEISPMTVGVDKLEEKRPSIDTAVPQPLAIPSMVVGSSTIRGPGLLGNMLQSSSQMPLLSTVLSSNISAANANSTTVKPMLTRSWSSGDIKALNKDNLAELNSLNPGLNQTDASRTRRNSSGENASASLANLDKDSFGGLGMRKRSNSSGSLSDLIKQADIKAATGSPPKTAPFVSFDSYGIEDYSPSFNSSSTATMTTTTATTSTTTTAASKPTGFLRSLFLGSSSTSNAPEPKRPSSVHEGDGHTSFGLGRGSAASFESGMNRFGNALAQDDFGSFGFGLMSYFRGSKKSTSDKS